ncbi:MAG: galactokinase, partial [Novosphingobium sp.]|nr:galactokinase [Novosphingobium sp.]
RAMGAAAEVTLAATELAKAAQLTEHNWAGVQCGIMDQMAIAAGEPDHALLLDCRNLAARLVPLPSDWAVAIIQSGVTRGLVDGHYNARRRDCEAAAKALGLSSLRDADPAMIAAAGLDSITAARATHVVSEIARTRAAVAAIEARDLAALGDLLRASHASLRDQFEVSVPAVDRLVDLANAAIGPNGGARMTGGGFGGAVVAVLERSAVPKLIARLEHEFADQGSAPLNLMIEGTGGPTAGNAL